MKKYIKYIQCSECGRIIPVCNAHYIDGKPYGYSCYKKQLTLLYKQWEDEKNAEYSAKCFAAMQVFEGKKNNSFHDSICKQWHDCKKLTAKQLDCIIEGFSQTEKINFWITWQALSNDEILKRSISAWVENEIGNFQNYIDNAAVINCLLYDRKYRNGFHFLKDTDDPDIIFIMPNGKDGSILKENRQDEELEILKVVKKE